MKTYILIADINFNERSDIEEMAGKTFDCADSALAEIDNSPDEFYSGEKSRSRCISVGTFCTLVNDEFYNDSSNWIVPINITT